jgi:Holliday junction resolvase RusA-like endonuclease
LKDLYFRVDGSPAPQGSKTAYVRGGRAVLVEANKRLPEWREAVTAAARIAMHDMEQVTPFDQPIMLEVTFFIAKPAKPKHPVYPGSKPDLDHYIRAVGDSLTRAGAIVDDSLIVDIVAKKRWCGSTTDTYPTPGCSVFVTVV